MSESYAPRPRPAPRRGGRRLSRNILIVIVIAIGLGAVLTFCAVHKGRGGFGGRGRPATTVGIAKAVSGDIPIMVSALGTVTPQATVSVNARVSGELVSVNFREGQSVRRGQVLAQIDPRPFQAAEDQAKGQLARDEASLADARLDLARYRTLHAQDSIAEQTLDTQAALVKQDAAAVASDKASVETAALNLDFSRITSPITGRIGLRQIDPGNQISANQTTPVAVVTQMDPITVIFSVPESDIGLIQQQGAAGLQTTALDRDGGAVLAQGRLSTLDNLIDTTTGTVKARAEFNNPKGALFPNQFVNVSLLVKTLKNQVVVPTTAVRHGPQGDFVWVLQPDETVKSQAVTVGPGTSETVSIASGLSVGQTVITDGGDRLTDGGKVVLPGQVPAAGPGKRSRRHGKGGGHGRHGGRGGGNQSGGGSGGGSQGGG